MLSIGCKRTRGKRTALSARSSNSFVEFRFSFIFDRFLRRRWERPKTYSIVNGSTYLPGNRHRCRVLPIHFAKCWRMIFLFFASLSRSIFISTVLNECARARFVPSNLVALRKCSFRFYTIFLWIFRCCLSRQAQLVRCGVPFGFNFAIKKIVIIIKSQTEISKSDYPFKRSNNSRSLQSTQANCAAALLNFSVKAWKQRLRTVDLCLVPHNFSLIHLAKAPFCCGSVSFSFHNFSRRRWSLSGWKKSFFTLFLLFPGEQLSLP